MAYKIFIRNDYKPVVRWIPEQRWYRRPVFALLLPAAILVICGPLIIPSTISPPEPENPAGKNRLAGAGRETVVETFRVDDKIETGNMSARPPTLPDPVKAIPPAEQWEKIIVGKGDNLSLIFDRMGISPSVLHKVITASPENRSLTRLLPGQELRFLMDDGKLLALEYDRDILTTLRINRSDDRFDSEILKSELQTKIFETGATINSSLFIAGQRAGLSDNLIMQLVAIYGWDIDFVMDIRKGDSFRLIYEEQYKGDTKVAEGPILAAEFINRDKSYRAVRYAQADGRADYYSDDGTSMRKAFLRTPLNFTRISSGFSLNRRHPVLNTIRAHRGVDYAAPAGTPVKAAGDGTITSIGTNGGYGRVITIKHGGTYSTLYAHLSRYARGLKKGSRVSQGQTIGYVGMTGLATGPHLHYEFRVHGVHRNPLTVQLPKAESIPEKYLPDFRDKTAPLLARLENRGQAAGPAMLALREQDPAEPEKTGGF